MAPEFRERCIAAACVLLVMACGGGEGRTSLDAAIAAVEPACVSNECGAAITINGSMPVKPRVSVSSGASTIDTTYRAWLGDVELLDVRWMDTATLTATVPAGLMPGVYSLAIESPFGSRDVLDGFQVASGRCDAARAVLAVQATASPEHVRAGDRVVVSAVVRNDGDVAATSVTATVTPPVGFTVFTSPTDALELAPGLARTFTWTFTAVAGSGTFSIGASGTDAGTGDAVAAVGTSTNQVVVDAAPGTQTFAIGGTIAGLTGSGLVLGMNDGNDLVVPAGSKSFTFPTALADGATYRVSVFTQPSAPTQSCRVDDGTGTVAGANVTTIRVSCVTTRFTIGGPVTGLAGSGLVLQLNGGADLPVPATASTYAFPAVSSGTVYTVTIRTQPKNPSQTCAVANSTGIVGGANVTNAAVTCTTDAFDVGGSVSGLAGTGLVLQLNGAGDLPVGASGAFLFPEVLSGSAYAVTVLTQPTNPSQSCTVANATGVVGDKAVTGVTVSCVTLRFRVGGDLTGLLEGNKVDLALTSDSGTSSLALTQDGPFVFQGTIPSGTSYRVSVKAQPRRQSCTVGNATGTVTDRDVTTVEVTCTTTQ